MCPASAVMAAMPKLMSAVFLVLVGTFPDCHHM